MTPGTYSCSGSMFAPEASFNLAMLKTATDIAIAIYKLLSASSFPGHILVVHYIDVNAGSPSSGSRGCDYSPASEAEG